MAGKSVEYDVDQHEHQHVDQHEHQHNKYKFKHVFVNLDINEYDDDRIILWQEHIFTSCEENDGS